MTELTKDPVCPELPIPPHLRDRSKHYVRSLFASITNEIRSSSGEWSVLLNLINKVPMEYKDEELFGYILRLALVQRVICSELIDYLIEQKPSTLRAEDSEGCLPLHTAVMSYTPDIKIISKLISAYPSALSARNYFGENCLHLAVKNEHPDEHLIATILRADTDSVAVRSFTNTGKLPIHVLLQSDRVTPPAPSCVSMLLRAYPQSAVIEVHETVTRIPINFTRSNEPADGEPRVHVTEKKWSPYSAIESLASATEECEQLKHEAQRVLSIYALSVLKGKVLPHSVYPKFSSQLI
mmetsp:Transcript_10813/g.16458  ORF Transcript_10813/g.16458 Transcript_10813/m.16458 type:complete len:296 (+) Transcript_10813:65-952(+)|eukprot:CAMPEP_0185034348 /NCGR_PEP_ID=MMETSP1103-20130426/24146_1 /TAXON_ID=36769 /ORGANISM="Paraphysomonas bandaiensis, Strain Caron Lab Isolate" /LENGTH=295 /DNA_ID=CAMNT_0027570969 /DNA_START=37 /DNA_END=924 /DNA_ORIENTATION=+